jgi:hypothetical protein
MPVTLLYSYFKVSSVTEDYCSSCPTKLTKFLCMLHVSWPPGQILYLWPTHYQLNCHNSSFVSVFIVSFLTDKKGIIWTGLDLLFTKPRTKWRKPEKVWICSSGMVKRVAVLCQVYQRKMLKSFSSKRSFANWREIPHTKNDHFWGKHSYFQCMIFCSPWKRITEVSDLCIIDWTRII